MKIGEAISKLEVGVDDNPWLEEMIVAMSEREEWM